MSYIRFVIPQPDADSASPQGLFQAVREATENPLTPTYVVEALHEPTRWFDENLSAPNRFNRTKSKGYYRRAAAGISWIKPEASAHIAKMREIAELLKEQGFHVSQLQTRRPGYIVYEDDHQIVAEPFSDTTIGS